MKKGEMFRVIHIHIFWILFISCSFGQFIKNEAIPAAHLINSDIKEGAILSTLDGAFLYNGVDVEKIKLQGYSNANIQSKIFRSSDNTQWCTLYDGILHILPDTCILDKISIGGSEKQENYYAFDLRNEWLYFKQGNDAWRYNVHNSTFQDSIPIDTDLAGRRVKVFEWKGELIWATYFYTDRPSVVIIDSMNAKVTERIDWDWPLDLMVNDVEFVKGQLFFATDAGIYIGDLQSKKITKAEGLNNEELSIKGLVEYGNNQFLINVHNYGAVVAEYENLKFEIREVSYPFYEYGDIGIMEKDKLGNILFTSGRKGAQSINLTNRKFQFIPFDVPSQIYKTYNDHLDQVWVGNNDRTVVLNYDFDLNKYVEVQDYSLKFPLSDSKYHAIFEKDIFLIDNKAGLSYYQQDGNVKLPILPGTKMYGIFEKEEGGYWLTSSAGDIYRFQSDLLKDAELIYQGDSTSTFNYVQRISSNRFLGQLSETEIYFFSESENVIKDTVIAFNGKIRDVEIDFPWIWISAESGLFKVNAEDYEIVAIGDKFPEFNQKMAAIYAYDYNTIFVVGDNGMFAYNTKKDTFISYTVKDGYFPARYINQDMQDKAGNIYFPSRQGLLKLLPKSYWHDSEDYPVSINVRELRINNVLTRLESQMDLKYAQNTLSILFEAIDLTSPSEVRLFYRLLNRDKNWIEAPSLKYMARYTELLPGTYNFEIKAINGFGFESKLADSFTITISPPFWQTWWFRLLALAALGLIAYRSFRTYVGQKLRRKNLLLREQRLIIEKKEAVENERSRIAAEMHDDLGGGLTTIKFLSQKALKNIKDEKQAKDIGKIGKYSTQLVQNLSEIIWAMNGQFDSLEGLLAYVRNYAHEFLEDNQMELNFPYLENIPKQSISGEKRRNVFLVIKEALNNAVRHSGADQVRIVVRCEKELIIRIMDNGAGLPDNIREHGNGLSNMTKRMQRIGGNCTFKPMDGLCVELTLPLSKN